MTGADARAVDQVTTAGLSLTRLVELWVAATGLALLLVASAYVAAHQLSGPLVVAGGGEVTLGIVTVFTVVGGSVGAVFAVVIGRFSRRPRPTFLVATLIALAGYAVVPLAIARSIGTAFWLSLLHVVAAVPVIGILARWLPEDRTSGGA